MMVRKLGFSWQTQRATKYNCWKYKGRKHNSSYSKMKSFTECMATFSGGSEKKNPSGMRIADSHISQVIKWFTKIKILLVIIYNTTNGQQIFTLFFFKLCMMIVCEEIELKMKCKPNWFDFLSTRAVWRCKIDYFKHFALIYSFLQSATFKEKLVTELEYS